MRSELLRKSAIQQECTFEIAGVCNYDRSTTVLCHLPDENKGIALKSSDMSAAFGCSACHDVVDGRVHSLEYEEQKWFYNYRARSRTIEQWIKDGVLSIEKTKA